MLFQNTKHVKIADSIFDGNHQDNLNVRFGDIVVTNSTFTDGSKSHIFAFQSSMLVKNVTMFDSYDYS